MIDTLTDTLIVEDFGRDRVTEGDAPVKERTVAPEQSRWEAFRALAPLVGLAFFCFLGYMTFFVHTIFLLVHYFLGIVTAICVGDAVAILYDLAWLLYSVPLFDFLISCAWAILKVVFELGDWLATLHRLIQERFGEVGAGPAPVPWRLHVMVIGPWIACVVIVVLGLFVNGPAFEWASYIFTPINCLIMTKDLFLRLLNPSFFGLPELWNGGLFRGWVTFLQSPYYISGADEANESMVNVREPTDGDLERFRQLRKGKWKVDRIHFDWGAYTRSDINPMRCKELPPKLSMLGAIILLIVVEVLDAINVDRHGGRITWFLVRLCINVAICPFMVTQNVFIFFWNFHKIHDRGFEKFRFSLMISRGIQSLMVVLIIVFAISRAAIAPFTAENFTFEPLTHTNVTNVTEAWICRTELSNWSLIELAGLSVAAHHIGDGKVWDILRMVFDNRTSRDSYEETNTASRVPVLIVTKPNNSVAAVVVQGIRSAWSIGIMTENIAEHYVFQFNNAMIPYYSDLMGMVFEPFYDLSEYVVLRNLLGVSHLTVEAWDELKQLLEYDFTGKVIWGKYHKPDMLFVGHSSGGLMAKALAASSGKQAAAFESPQYEDSAIGGELNTEILAVQNVVNVLGGSGIFSYDEGALAVNIHVPEPGSYFKLLNPYKVFCQIAAGCISDDRFDEFCKATVGMDKYVEYFELWGRPRSQAA